MIGRTLTRRPSALLTAAFAVFTTVPWNHTTKRYQTDLLQRHDGTKPWPRYRRDGSDGTIEIERLGVALTVALLIGYWRTSSKSFCAFFRVFLRFLRFSVSPCPCIAQNRVEMDLFADSMPYSPLTDPGVDIYDVDVDLEIEPEFDASRPSTPASTSSSLPRRGASRPHSLSPNFFGHSFKQAGYKCTIWEKSALKKGGKPSYI
jgi:hypothetical protein